MTNHYYVTNILADLDRLARENDFNAGVLREELDTMLDRLVAYDFFGTAGRVDPRGSDEVET